MKVNEYLEFIHSIGNPFFYTENNIQGKTWYSARASLKSSDNY